MKANIDGKGRVARAITGMLTLALGVVAWWLEWPSAMGWRWVVIVLAMAGGLFQLFEAKQSWCVTRACGFKTPM